MSNDDSFVELYFLPLIFQFLCILLRLTYKLERIRRRNISIQFDEATRIYQKFNTFVGRKPEVMVALETHLEVSGKIPLIEQLFTLRALYYDVFRNDNLRSLLLYRKNCNVFSLQNVLYHL